MSLILTKHKIRIIMGWKESFHHEYGIAPFFNGLKESAQIKVTDYFRTSSIR
jgi:hypothetical protein